MINVKENKIRVRDRKVREGLLFYLGWSKNVSIVRWHLRKKFKEGKKCGMWMLAETSICKGPEAGTCLGCLRNCKETSLLEKSE